ncbi:STAS domain-containing protein [candidate division CSSED10-310 bacterium]|uniref:Anti-sigma factor antagonist n=1 Tax=candidate division CSSED10-310 bacterium TaxID=2855610 RepID=A0ABV6YY78_UNCC1
MVLLAIDIREQVDTVVLKLKGILNGETAHIFENTLHNYTDKGIYKLIVDFEHLEFLSSSGVGCFIGNIKMIRDKGGDIRFVAVHPKIRRVFQILEFDGFFHSFESLDEALASFQG